VKADTRVEQLMRPAVVVMLVLGVAGAVPAQGQRGTFRASVDLVTLSATVTGPNGRYISDLDAADFIVLEDGRKQDISFFERAKSPLAVSLLIDSSGSMSREMPMARHAASEFVARLRPGDLAAIVDFDRRVQVLQPFTDDRAALERAIERMVARGTTSMFNAIYIALRDHSALPKPAGDEIRRDVIVVLSDGDDTSSLVTHDQLLDGAKRSPTVIYAIGLGIGDPRTRRGPTPPEYALRSLAYETGGRLFLPKNADALSGIYNDIADELASQYVLGYVSTSTSPRSGWRALSVRVSRPGLHVRSRPGYYATASR
jgi:Ca-activated chloride channel family protein